MKTKDNVKNPSHYTAGSIQPIEYMRANFTPEQFQAYVRGNVIKYITRYDRKNGLEDLKKAQVYLGWLVESISTSSKSSRNRTRG